jgi:hypothetical protein
MIHLLVGNKSYFKTKYNNLKETNDINLLFGLSTLLFNNNMVYLYSNEDITERILPIMEGKIKVVNECYICLPTIDQRTKFYKWIVKNGNIEYEPAINEQTVKELMPMLTSAKIDLIIKNVHSYSELVTVANNVNAIGDPNAIYWFCNINSTDYIFECIDHLLLRNTTYFYPQYKSLINLGESNFKLLILLQNRLKQLIQIKPYAEERLNEITNKTGLNNYMVKNSIVIANKYSLNTLRKWYLLTVKLEEDIKTGKEKEQIGVNNLFLTILGGGANQ